MGSIGLVYDAIRIKLDHGNRNILYQTMIEDPDKGGRDNVGIYLYESTNDLVDTDGLDIANNIKVHVQVNAGTSTEEMMKALDYLTEFTRRIETERSEIPMFKIIDAKHLGPRALAIGKNSYDIQVCRSIIDLKYKIV